MYWLWRTHQGTTTAAASTSGIEADGEKTTLQHKSVAFTVRKLHILTIITIINGSRFSGHITRANVEISIIISACWCAALCCGVRECANVPCARAIINWTYFTIDYISLTNQPYYGCISVYYECHLRKYSRHHTQSSSSSLVLIWFPLWLKSCPLRNAI